MSTQTSLPQPEQLSASQEQHLREENELLPKDQEEGSTTQLLSKSTMLDILQKMLTQGYFHVKENNNVKEDSNSNNDDNPNFSNNGEEEKKSLLVEQMKQHQKQWNDKPTFSLEDDDCQLVLSSSKKATKSLNQLLDDDDGSATITILTKEKLGKELKQYLSQKKKNGVVGRISVSNAADLFQVDTEDIELAVANTTRTTSNNGDPLGKMYQIGSDILSESYIHDLLSQVLYSSNTLPLSYSNNDDDNQCDGRISMSDILSNIFRVPIVGDGTDAFRRVVEEQLNDIIISENDGDDDDDGWMWTAGKREIVSKEYVRRFRCEVRGAMRGLTVPTPLESLASEFGWDPILLAEQIQSMCLDGTIPGELHGSGGGTGATKSISSSRSPRDLSSSSASTSVAVAATLQTAAIYIPNIYTSMQQKCVSDFFTANGYITVEICRSMGISDGRMDDYVLELFPRAVCLSSIVINTDIMLSPLEAAVQESMTSDTFVDLKMHLPEALLIYKDDVSKILHDLVLPNIIKEDSVTKVADKIKEASSLDGVAVIGDGEALYFSSGMIQSICTTIIPPLVETYGKARAEDIDRAMSEATQKKRATSFGDDDDDEALTVTSSKSKKATTKRGGKGGKSENDGGNGSTRKLSAREKRRNRKNAKAASSTSSSAGYPSGVVPLYQVAKRIAEEYPDLYDIQEAHGGIVDNVDEERSLLWENDGGGVIEGGFDACKSEGPLYEFCRQALYTSTFIDTCDRAVRAELDKIVSAKQGLVSSRKDGATRVQSIEAAFEDSACFAAACQQIQMFAKSAQALSSSDKANVGARLERDLLVGCAANFARRVTEYCLFKNDVESGIFVFDSLEGLPSDKNKEDRIGLPSFCSPVDVSCRSFGSVYLSCTPDDDGKARDPLLLLRQEFSGSVGVALAQMWTLCGGECYFGGKKTSDDGSESIRSGDLECFLRHAEESCLSMCGLPFKVLDKKGEKQVMFARKKGLKQDLEQASNGKDVLELSTLLIFQQVKHMAIVNSVFMDDILDLLANEKKISCDVIYKLKELQDCLKNAHGVSEELITEVKSCGLSKDISKHIIE